MRMTGHTLALLLLAVALAASGQAGEAVRIPLEVFASQAEVAAYPIEIGMPFPAGALKNAAQLRLLGPDGAEVPCQVEELSRYTDGSLRATLLVFISPISKDKPLQYTVEFGESVTRKAAPAAPVKVSGVGPVSIDTGALKFQVGAGKALLSAATAGGKPALAGGIEQFIQEAGQTSQLAATPGEVKVEESGPVRAVVLLKGRFGSAPEAHGYEVRVHAYAGSTLVRVQQTVLGLDGKKALELAGWGLRIPAGAKKAQCGLDGAAKELALSVGGGLFQDGVFKFMWGSLSDEERGNRLKKRGSPLQPGEMPGWGWEMSCAVGNAAPARARADGWLLAETAGGGSVAVCVRDFWQQYPKEFSASDKDVTVWLHSPRGKPFLARAGTAKTHELLFDFGSVAGNPARVAALNAVFQDWPHARVAPEWACASGAFGPLLPRSDSFSEPYNAMADAFLGFVTRDSEVTPYGSSWYLRGNSEHGDISTTIFNYNGVEGQAEGFTKEYARGGDREWARLGARAARHYADIDVCHAETGESNVGRPWAAIKVGCIYGATTATDGFHALEPKDRAGFEAEIAKGEKLAAAVEAPRFVHQWKPAGNRGAAGDYASDHTGGVLQYYLVSGDRRAREVLGEMGEFMLKARPDKNSIPFRLSGLLDAHEATGDVKFLKGAAAVIGELLALWRTPPEQMREYIQAKQWAASKKPPREYQPPPHGFWDLIQQGGRPVAGLTRRDAAVFRFLELNAPEAGTGSDSGEVRKMAAECIETLIVSGGANSCTPTYIYPWTLAANLGLWPEETRREFEERVLLIVTVGRNDFYLTDYRAVKDGKTLLPALKYKLPFLRYDYRKGGVFAALDPKAYLAQYNPLPYTPFSCKPMESAVQQVPLFYPHFVAVWKKYHEKYLKPRMNADGTLEFVVAPAGREAGK